MEDLYHREDGTAFFHSGRDGSGGSHSLSSRISLSGKIIISDQEECSGAVERTEKGGAVVGVYIWNCNCLCTS